MPIAVKKVRRALNFSVKSSPNTVKSYPKAEAIAYRKNL